MLFIPWYCVIVEFITDTPAAILIIRHFLCLKEGLTRCDTVNRHICHCKILPCTGTAWYRSLLESDTGKSLWKLPWMLLLVFLCPFCIMSAGTLSGPVLHKFVYSDISSPPEMFALFLLNAPDVYFCANGSLKAINSSVKMPKLSKTVPRFEPADSSSFLMVVP
jgi:hypothetical protein